MVLFIFTSTVHLASLPSAVALMMAWPQEMPTLTTPLLFTVATPGLSLLQVTVLNEALSGLTVAVSFSDADSPFKLRVVLFSVMLVTGTFGNSTLQVAFVPDQVS